MSTNLLGAILAAAFVVAAPAQVAPRGQSTPATQNDRQDVDNDAQQKGDVTFGRIKEMSAGKVVIDVDNRIDKSFDQNDTKTKLRMAGTLKVGDPVKVTEVDQDGRKMVTIAFDDNPNVKHGDRTAAELRGDDRNQAIRTDEADAAEGAIKYGRIKELNAGREVVVQMDDNVNHTFNLTDNNPKVAIADDLKAGDKVKVTESEQDGHKMVTIAHQSATDVRTDEAGDVRKAGKSAKQAGKSAADSAEHAGKAAGNAAERGAEAVGQSAKKAGKTVKDKAKDATDR